MSAQSSQKSQETKIDWGIHYLSLPKMTRAFKPESTLSSLVQRVVDYYNESVKSLSPPYKQIKTLEQPKWPANFTLTIYAQKITSHSKITKFIAKLGGKTDDLTLSRVQYLFFLTRGEKNPECFALTSGHSWHVVQKFSDYTFPGKIARRLLAPELRSARIRNLVGNVISDAMTFKDPEKVSRSEAMGRFYESARFHLRDTSSLFDFECFQTKKGKPTKRGVTLEIGMAQVRFLKDFSLKEMSTMLDHFATIMRGEKTYEHPKSAKKEELDSEDFDYFDYLHPVDMSLASSLDKALVSLVFQAVCENKVLPTLDFCHKHRQDFYTGQNFQIQYKSKTIDCQNPFSASSMVEELKSIKALQASPDLETFTQALARVTVSFTSKSGGQKVTAPFLNYLEGELRVTKEWCTYWRLHTVWYEVNADYLGLIHQEFGALVSKCLLKPGEAGYLAKPWSTSVSEASYNKSYIDEPHCLVGDTICPEGTELFDIMIDTPSTLALVQVKEGFDQHTRDACSQIFNAMRLIVNTQSSKQGLHIVDAFYDMR